MRALTLFALGAWLAAGTALAQPAPKGPSVADVLFQEGRDLLEAGRAEEACPRFEASQKLDPARGTLINIAACYAALGRLVDALAVYRDVEQQSLAAGDQTRVTAARAEIAVLEQRIPHVTFTIAQRVPGLAIELDARVVPEGEWADHRRDPGQYPLRVSAPGHVDYTETVTVKAGGATTTLAIPALATIASPVPNPVMPPPRPVVTERSPSRKRLAYLVGGSGLALVGASTALAFVAKSKHDGADCAGDPLICATDDDVRTTRDARTLGNVATVIGATGLVAVGAGVVLYLTAPRTETVVVPTLSPDSAGVSLSGRF